MDKCTVCSGSLQQLDVSGQNEGAQLPVRLSASLSQGIASFMITLLLVTMVERLSPLFRSYRARLIMPCLLTVSATASGLTVMHHQLGTPNLLLTVTPPTAIALLFYLYTSHRLLQQELSNDA